MPMLKLRVDAVACADSYPGPPVFTTIAVQEVEVVFLLMKLARLPCCVYEPSVYIKSQH